MNSHRDSSRQSEKPGRSPVRQALYALLGVVFVAIAGIGVFLPGIPTVGPLLIASVLLTKSNPRLEQRLIRNRFFARFLPYLDGSAEMPIKAKLVSIATMWTSIAISCALLWISKSVPNWVIGLVIAAGIVGTCFILQFGKKSDPRDVDASLQKRSS